jgi:uncharacterized protein
MKFGPECAFCGIAVMAKASQGGRTKTRLCPPLTPDEAASFNTAFLKDISDNLIAASAESSIAGSMAYAPPGSEDFFQSHLPASISLHEVWYPDFGLCLKAALRRQFEAGHSAACVLNSDSPTLPVALLTQMVRLLQEPGERAVLGPSMDGGYYLLACKSIHPRLFQDIAWSTDAVAAQTLDRAREIGLPIHILPAWYDVDDCGAIDLLIGELLDGKPFSESLKSSPALHSRALLQSLAENSDLKERLDRFKAAERKLPEVAA